MERLKTYVILGNLEISLAPKIKILAVALECCKNWTLWHFAQKPILLKAAVTIIRYFARSKFSTSFVHKKSFDLIWNVSFKLKYLFCQGRQVRIQHLKKVSQTNEIVVFPFISFLFPFLFISFYFIQGCLTSHMYHYQSTGGVRILDMPLGFFCYSSVKINTHGWCSNVLRHLVGAQMCYSICIIRGHSIIALLQTHQNLDSPSPLVCTCLSLIL